MPKLINQMGQIFVNEFSHGFHCGRRVKPKDCIKMCWNYTDKKIKGLS